MEQLEGNERRNLGKGERQGGRRGKSLEGKMRGEGGFPDSGDPPASPPPAKWKVIVLL